MGAREAREANSRIASRICRKTEAEDCSNGQSIIGDCFKQGRLARTVLSDEENDWFLDFKIAERSDCRHVERIIRPIANTLSEQRDSL
jgi:hypothetical protein